MNVEHDFASLTVFDEEVKRFFGNIFENIFYAEISISQREDLETLA